VKERGEVIFEGANAPSSFHLIEDPYGEHMQLMIE
jgi:hypothetical protein